MNNCNYNTLDEETYHNTLHNSTPRYKEVTQHDLLMKEYYKHNQDKMTIKFKLKTRIFLYLANDDNRLKMSDRQNVEKEYQYSSIAD